MAGAEAVGGCPQWGEVLEEGEDHQHVGEGGHVGHHPCQQHVGRSDNKCLRVISEVNVCRSFCHCLAPHTVCDTLFPSIHHCLRIPSGWKSLERMLRPNGQTDRYNKTGVQCTQTNYLLESLSLAKTLNTELCPQYVGNLQTGC